MTRIVNELHTGDHLLTRVRDERFDLLGGKCGPLGQFSNFLGNDCEALPSLPCPCSLNTCIESKKVRLEGNLINYTDDFTDLGRRVGDLLSMPSEFSPKVPK